MAIAEYKFIEPGPTDPPTTPICPVSCAPTTLPSAVPTESTTLVPTPPKLYRWMGLPVDDEVMTAVEERASRAVATYGMGTPVGSGKWRELDPPDLDRLTAVAGDLLAELGYLDEGAP